MALRATVVLSTFASIDRRALESLDRQSLRVSEFEVVIVDDGTDHQALQRITELARNRPNVKHVAVAAGASAAARRGSALAAASGDYVLVLDEKTVLGDESLGRLADYADETRADICLGKTSQAGVQPDTARVPGESTSRMKADDVLEAFDLGRLYRRRFLEEAGLESVAVDGPGFDLTAASRTDAISVLATYPAFSRLGRPSLTTLDNQLRSIAGSPVPDDLRDRAMLAVHQRNLEMLLGSPGIDVESGRVWEIANDSVPALLDERLKGNYRQLSTAARAGDQTAVERLARDTDARPKARKATARWLGQVLELTAQIEPADTSPAPSTARQVVGAKVTVFRRADGLEWMLADADVQLDHSTDSGKTTLTARLRPELLAGGGWLDHGVWLVAATVSVGGVEHRLRVPLPKNTPIRTSFVDGVPVVSFSNDGRLGIDVGAVRQPVVSRLRPDDSAVVEDARGSLLTIPLPDVELPDGAEVSGQLRIGRLPVPAVISDGGGSPVLRAWVSGLAGSYPLATKFSPAPYARTGLALEIDEVGAMRTRKATGKRPTLRSSRRPAPATAASVRIREAVKRLPGTENVYRKLRAAVGR